MGTLFTFLSFTSQAAVIVPKAPDLDASAYILMDAESGRILVEHNADERLPPASLTKMMTSYIAVHELETGNVAEDTLVPISEKAWRKGGSKMFVEYKLLRQISFRESIHHYELHLRRTS